MTELQTIRTETTIHLSTPVDLMATLQKDVERKMALDAADRGMYLASSVEHEFDRWFYEWGAHDRPWRTVTMHSWAFCAPIVALWEAILDD